MNIEIGNVSKLSIDRKADYLREKMGEDLLSPIDVFSLAQSIDNLTICICPMGSSISGVCFKGEDTSVIAINSEMSLGRQRFSLAHELYHLYFDSDYKSEVSLIKIGSGGANERNADKFASFFLIPQTSLVNKLDQLDNSIELADVIRLEQFYGVSHHAMLYRLVDDGFLSKADSLSMKEGVIAKAKRLGYADSIYLPLSDKNEIKVLGHYVNIADELYANNRISKGKYEQLLLDAFRDDIVYGLTEEVDID